MSELKRLIFGPEIWNLQKFGGISRYFSEIIPRVISLSGNLFEVEIWDTDSNNIYLDKLRTDFKIQQPKFETLNHNSIYHQTYFDSTKMKYAKKMGAYTIVNIYDMIPEKLQLESKSTLFFGEKRKTLRYTDQVICISKTSKRDFDQFFGTKITAKIIYLGVEQPSTNEKINKNGRPYFVYVGNRHNYKNFNFFLQSALSLSSTHCFDILAIGGEDFSSHELRIMEKLYPAIKVSRSVLMDEQLWESLIGSVALVVTSSYEGFSLPILEAIVRNVKVICSDIPVHRELYDGCVTFFQIDNQASLTSSLTSILDARQSINDRRKCSDEFLSKYSWERCANEHLEIYQSVFNNE